MKNHVVTNLADVKNHVILRGNSSMCSTRPCKTLNEIIESLQQLERNEDQYYAMVAGVFGPDCEILQERRQRLAQQQQLAQRSVPFAVRGEPADIPTPSHRSPLPLYRTVGNCIVIDDDEDDGYIAAGAGRHRLTVTIDLTSDDDDDDMAVESGSVDNMSISESQGVGRGDSDAELETVESIDIELENAAAYRHHLECQSLLYGGINAMASDMNDWIDSL